MNLKKYIKFRLWLYGIIWTSLMVLTFISLFNYGAFSLEFLGYAILTTLYDIQAGNDYERLIDDYKSKNKGRQND